MDGEPPILYQYTSQEGLLGIIQKSELWATEIRYLNDSKEFLYAIEFARKKIKQIKKEYLPRYEGLLDKIEGELTNIEQLWKAGSDLAPYVCCFSCDENKLSMWRAYAQSGNGYSVGFNFKRLQSWAVKQGLRLSRCLYDEEADQLPKIKMVVDAARKCFDESQSDQPLVKSAQKFFTEFLDVAPELKHPKFNDEREWRLIGFPQDPSHLKFRPGKAQVIPYAVIPLKDKQEFLPIERIYVGPTSNEGLSIQSVQRLLRTMNQKNCSVDGSGIPYVP